MFVGKEAESLSFLKQKRNMCLSVALNDDPVDKQSHGQAGQASHTKCFRILFQKQKDGQLFFGEE